MSKEERDEIDRNLLEAARLTERLMRQLAARIDAAAENVTHAIKENGNGHPRHI